MILGEGVRPKNLYAGDYLANQYTHKGTCTQSLAMFTFLRGGRVEDYPGYSISPAGHTESMNTTWWVI